MGKFRNLLQQVKERVELEVREYENQQQQNTGSFQRPIDNNTQQNPALLGILGSSIDRALNTSFERSDSSVATLNSSLERTVLSDHNRHYETVFCETCLRIKTHDGQGSIYYGPGVNITLEDLESAVEDGCHFCFLLTQGLYTLVPDTKGTRAILNVEKGTSCLVVRVGKEDANLYARQDWPMLEFFTTKFLYYRELHNQDREYRVSFVDNKF